MNAAWLTIGARLIPVLVSAAHAVEALCNTQRGKAKQDAAIESARAQVAASERFDDAVLLEDPDVERAARLLINAYVTFQNVIARKAAPPAAP